MPEDPFEGCPACSSFAELLGGPVHAPNPEDVPREDKPRLHSFCCDVGAKLTSFKFTGRTTTRAQAEARKQADALLGPQPDCSVRSFFAAAHQEVQQLFGPGAAAGTATPALDTGRCKSTLRCGRVHSRVTAKLDAHGVLGTVCPHGVAAKGGFASCPRPGAFAVTYSGSTQWLRCAHHQRSSGFTTPLRHTCMSIRGSWRKELMSSAATARCFCQSCTPFNAKQVSVLLDRSAVVSSFAAGRSRI
jgi:hypothetical protein